MRASMWSKSKMLLPVKNGSIMRKYSRVTKGLPKASPMPVTPWSVSISTSPFWRFEPPPRDMP